jgi:hypothetical protein
MFVNSENPEMYDYQLDPGSPAIKSGFVQIPFRSIGLYKNKYRSEHR